METVQSLISLNMQYHHNFGLLQVDLDKANSRIHLIESTRKNYPVQGDRIICTGPKCKIYARGHLDTSLYETYSSICVSPSVPFVCEGHDEDGNKIPSFSTSGGYWLSMPDRNEYVARGQCIKQFCDWGSMGPRGGGAIHFNAKVNVWEIYKDSIY